MNKMQKWWKQIYDNCNFTSSS